MRRTILTILTLLALTSGAFALTLAEWQAIAKDATKTPVERATAKYEVWSLGPRELAPLEALALDADVAATDVLASVHLTLAQTYGYLLNDPNKAGENYLLVWGKLGAEPTVLKGVLNGVCSASARATIIAAAQKDYADGKAAGNSPYLQQLFKVVETTDKKLAVVLDWARAIKTNEDANPFLTGVGKDLLPDIVDNAPALKKLSSALFVAELRLDAFDAEGNPNVVVMNLKKVRKDVDEMVVSATK